MEATLLVELLTEELPPKSLKALSEAFGERLAAGLRQGGFLTGKSAARTYATPRRLAVSISRVLDRSPDKPVEFLGPFVTAPPQAVAGFARKNGVSVDKLVQVDSPKGKIFAYRTLAAGSQLDTNLDLEVDDALKRLPATKLMRWGGGEAQFVRPVHGLVMMHGAREVPGTVLGAAASSTTRGHRFMGSRSIALANADEYESRLESDGMVIADFAARRAAIEKQLLAEAGRRGASLGDYAGLLDEVTALVEHPTVYAGAYDPAFLAVPQECLILTMRQNQKYFPLFDARQRLQPAFLIVSNLRVADPRHIVGGNERVVRPRLEDARFFYNQDRKIRLEERVPLLAKADLVTGMVGEFPELQGTMGRYYALHDGEPLEVADAIEAHYRPRFAGDRLPAGPVACAVALADKLDALAGMFAVGGAPTGEKDPYGLRRAALGVLRILMEAKLPLDLRRLLEDAAAGFGQGKVPGWVSNEVYNFALDRLRHHMREHGYAPDEIEAVLSQLPARIDLVPARLEAVRTFRALPEAASLAEANKRIRNILRKSEEAQGAFDERLLREPAERALFASVERIEPEVASRIEHGDYRASLGAVAGLKGPVDAFFDKVLVNAEDAKLRANRHALLRRLDGLMNQVADLSKLAS